MIGVGIRETQAPVFGYGIVSPKDGRFVSAGTHLYDRQAAMKQAVKLCTIHGGTAPGETWRHLYRQGYRIVRVRIATAFHAASVCRP